MMTLVTGVLAGAIITFFVSHYFYRKANRDQRSLFGKMPKYIRQGLIEDKREKLTVKELNKLIRLKTIDKHKEGLKKFKACPKCGSKNIAVGSEIIDVDADGDLESGPTFTPIYANTISCGDCDWRKNEYDDLEV